MKITKKSVSFRWAIGILVLCILDCVSVGCSSSLSPVSSAAPTDTPPQALVVPTLSPTPQLTITPLVSPSAEETVIHRWLRGIPCRPSCYEGIQPGVTTPTQALALLSQNGFTRNARTVISAKDPDKGSIVWDWPNADAFDSGVATYHAQTAAPHINRISVTLTTPFLFRDVIASYGMPTSVIATADYGPDTSKIYNLFLLYTTQGFLLWVYKDPQRIPDVNGELKIINITFFPPSQQGLAEALPEMGIEQFAQFIQPWHGFDSFAAYCQHAFCRAAQAQP